MTSILAAPRQKDSSASRRAKIGSRFAAKTSAARSAASFQGSSRISDARMMPAAVELVYVLVALPYSGPARIGSLYWARLQQMLAGLLQINPGALPLLLPILKSSTSSALSPDVVRRMDTAASP